MPRRVKFVLVLATGSTHEQWIDYTLTDHWPGCEIIPVTNESRLIARLAEFGDATAFILESDFPAFGDAEERTQGRPNHMSGYRVWRHIRANGATRERPMIFIDHNRFGQPDIGRDRLTAFLGYRSDQLIETIQELASW